MSDIKQNFAVIGGDERFFHSAKCLADLGFEVYAYGFDKLYKDKGLCKVGDSLEEVMKACNVVILPINFSGEEQRVSMPYSEKTVTYMEIADSVRKDAFVFCGKIAQGTSRVFEEKGIPVFDYMQREELVIANACLTAESAVEITLRETEIALSGASVLVMGYGRIGKILCHILKGLGANVYASARKKADLEWIRAFGYNPVETSNICDVAPQCDVIFNTIPVLVLGSSELYCLRRDCLVIDLASKPGGVDFDAAKLLGLRVIWALALPGRNKPAGAGVEIAKTVLNILGERMIL